jgi:hypothetical protein
LLPEEVLRLGPARPVPPQEALQQLLELLLDRLQLLRWW